MKNPFKYFKTSPEIIRLAVMVYIRYPLSLRQVEDILLERVNQERHLYNRETFKPNRSATLAEWRQLAA